ncbi:MAG: hypothetical protein H7Y22_07465 [Gemmatimonadaceae bacterium]|nr:hypothetical protein [Gloeobacterales cyanobacterium ES-bin-141]
MRQDWSKLHSYAGQCKNSLRLGVLSVLACAVAVAPAFALTEEQVADKLNAVPVFTIMDQKGNPLIITVQDKDKKDQSVLPFFLDQKQVQDTYSNIQKREANLAKDSQISVISLGQAYKLIREEQKNKDSKIAFQFLSDAKTVDYALEVFKKSETTAKSFPGIPVFYAVGSDEKNKSKGFVTFEKDGKQYVPLFFDEKDIQRNVDELKKTKPELAKQMSVEVAPLDSVIGTMLAGKNDKEFEKLTFVPSLTAIQYLQTIQKPTKGATPEVKPTTPAPAPAKPEGNK